MFIPRAKNIEIYVKCLYVFKNKLNLQVGTAHMIHAFLFIYICV